MVPQQKVFYLVLASVVVQVVNICLYSSLMKLVIIGMMNGMMTRKVEEHRQRHGQIMQHTLQDRRYQNQAALVM
jgi:hypothetical protein